MRRDTDSTALCSVNNYPSVVYNADSTPEPIITAIDLFSGAGGFTVAAKEVGLSVLAAVEANTAACKTYRKNLVKDDNPRLYNEDILTLSPQKLMKDVALKRGQCDLVMGGPPCQGYSVHRIKNQGVNDPRNELILRYFHFVETFYPKMFILENVPGILWPRHKSYLDRFKKAAARAGYTVFSPVVLNAKDYGVPQNRKRVFILGIRKSIKALSLQWPPPATHADPLSPEVLRGTHLPWNSSSQVFETSVIGPDPNDVHMGHSQKLIDVFEATPINGGSRSQSGRILKCHKKHNGHKDVYGRINPSVPGPTMTTACINPSKGRFVHPTLPHGITLRQAARFQTFGDSFVFEGGLIAAAVQIGNAVPIGLGKPVLRVLREFLSQRELLQNNRRRQERRH